MGKFKVIQDDKCYNRLIYKQVSFEKVFYLCFSRIRNYASGDVAVQLLEVLTALDQKQKFKSLIEQERKALLINAD